jgi:hypothetical protein
MNDRGVGSTFQKEYDLALLNCQDYPGFLDLDIKNWSLDKRPQDPSFKGANLASSPSGDGDSMTSSGYPYKEGSVPEGSRTVSQASPSETLLFEVSLLSTMVAGPDIWSPLRGEFSKSCH